MATRAQRTRRQNKRQHDCHNQHQPSWPALVKSSAATLDAPPNTSAPDIAAILSARAGRRPGRLYKRGDSTFFDSNPAAAPVVDRGNMSATFCICTPLPDREDDVIVPEGVIFDEYRLNPVVLWDHGFSSLTLPVGTSEDRAGNLAIKVSPDSIDATCFFSQSLPEAEQLFNLVEEGIVRAASIHVDPIDAVVRVRNGAGDRPGLLVHTSNMIEWSLCGVGMNPEAVRKALSTSVCGRPLADGIAKSLRAYAAPTPIRSAGGWAPSITNKTAEPAMAKSLSKADDDKEEMAKRRKAYEENDEVKRLRKEHDDAKGDDDEAKSKRKGLRDKMKSLAKDAGLTDDDANIPDEPGRAKGDDTTDTTGDTDAERPLGSQILAAAYSALSEVTDQIEQATRPLENPQVKDYMGTMTDSLRGHMAEMDDLHKCEYPDHGELAKEESDSADPDNANNEPGEASGMVKFLSRAKAHRMGVKGIAHELMKIGNSKSMPKAHRERIALMSRRLSALTKAAEKGATTALSADDEKRYADLEKKVGELTEMLAQAIPHRRAG